MKLKGFLIGLGFVSFWIWLFLKTVKRTYDIGVSPNTYSFLTVVTFILFIIGLLSIVSPLVTEFFQKKKKR